MHVSIYIGKIWRKSLKNNLYRFSHDTAFGRFLIYFKNRFTSKDKNKILEVLKMLKLERIGDKVYHNGVELTIVPQSSKGEGHEQVKILGIPEANGREWISLKKLQEGENIFSEIELKKRESTKNYELTEDEQKLVDEYHAKIAEIIEAAKARYVKPVKQAKKSINQMNPDELQEHIAHLQSLLAAKLK